MRQETNPDKQVPEPAWSLNLVASWCEERAKQTGDRKLLKQLRARYIKGDIRTACERFASALQEEIDEKTEFWMDMANTFREEARNKPYETQTHQAKAQAG